MTDTMGASLCTRNKDIKTSDSKQSSEKVSSVKVGIIGAMPEELAKLHEKAKTHTERKHGKYITFYEGVIDDCEVVYALSNVGMVFASSVATTMIDVYGATHVIFTGVGGGLKEGQSIGDIVIAKDLINYDFNCKNFEMSFAPDKKFERGEIPFVGLKDFACDEKLIQLALEAPHPSRTPVVARVVTGSEFVVGSRKKELKPLWEELGNPHIVEMEWRPWLRSAPSTKSLLLF